jgi:hypothetical protein
MSACFDIAKNKILPVIEKIVDIESYIKYDFADLSLLGLEPNNSGCAYKNISNLEKKYGDGNLLIRWSGFSHYNQYAYLYKAYKEQNFKSAYELFAKRIEKENFYNEKSRKWYTDIFIEKMSANDLNWIEEYRLKRREYLLPKLRNELGINTDNL